MGGAMLCLVGPLREGLGMVISLAFPGPAARSVVAALDGHRSHRSAETVWVHVHVDALILPCSDLESLVEEAKGMIDAHQRPHFQPCREVLPGRSPGIFHKLIKGAPILHDDGWIAHVCMTAQEPTLWVILELLKHAPHGLRHRQPGAYMPPAVPAEADMEDHEITLDLCCGGLSNQSTPLCKARRAVGQHWMVVLRETLNEEDAKASQANQRDHQ